MFYSGIADEGAEDLAGQIRAHQELGWKHVEIRNLSGTNLTDITDEEFERETDEPQRKRRKKDDQSGDNKQPTAQTDQDPPVAPGPPAAAPQNRLNAMMYSQQCYVPVVPHYVYQHPQPPGHPMNMPNLSPYHCNPMMNGAPPGPMPPPHQFFNPMMNMMNPMSMHRAAMGGPTADNKPNPANGRVLIKSLKEEEEVVSSSPGVVSTIKVVTASVLLAFSSESVTIIVQSE